MSKNKNKKSKKSSTDNIGGTTDLIKNQNQEHNIKKESLGPNTKR